MSADPPMIRVERGWLTDEELAALVAALLVRVSAPSAPPVGVGWERPERDRVYRSPTSWRR
jgi:hypothetical protein